MNKRVVYITAFAFLGFLIQQLIHAFLESYYISLLIGDFEKFGLGLTWTDWYLIHHAATVILFISGVTAGFFQGKYWWKRLYEKDSRTSL